MFVTYEITIRNKFISWAYVFVFLKWNTALFTLTMCVLSCTSLKKKHVGGLFMLKDSILKSALFIFFGQEMNLCSMCTNLLNA